MQISTVFVVLCFLLSLDSPGAPVSAKSHQLFKGFSFIAPAVIEVDINKVSECIWLKLCMMQEEAEDSGIDSNLSSTVSEN